LHTTCPVQGEKAIKGITAILFVVNLIVTGKGIFAHGFNLDRELAAQLNKVITQLRNFFGGEPRFTLW
jgi:hypothetical protein